MMKHEPYDPCPCGSGKKYKFCCYRRPRGHARRDIPFRLESEPGVFSASDARSVFVGDLDEAMRWNRRGLDLMAQSETRKAQAHFRKAIKSLPTLPTGYNNLALCRCAEGDAEGALRTQWEGLEVSPLPNPFGQANLASFLWMLGRDEEAEQALAKAMTSTLPSEDACVKVCETLGRFRRHADLLHFADASDYTGSADLAFLTGIAAANLGQRDRARADLRRVALGHPKADIAHMYLQWIDDGMHPNTVRGDWPYLTVFETIPQAVVKRCIKDDESGWLASRRLVDFCEACMNEAPQDAENMIPLLGHAKHPAALDLLLVIAQGSFGPDTLRMAALHQLGQRDALPEESLEVLLRGKRTRVGYSGIQLNPELRYGGDLPPELAKRYQEAVQAAQGSHPDWEANTREFAEIARLAPTFYPARFNYAAALINQNRQAEAEPIVREIATAHPGYLFAPAALLQLLLAQNRTEEAAEFFKDFRVPDETHPAAFVAWLVAQIKMLDAQGDYDRADECIQTLEKLQPDHPAIKALRP